MYKVLFYEKLINIKQLFAETEKNICQLGKKNQLNLKGNNFF